MKDLECKGYLPNMNQVTREMLEKTFEAGYRCCQIDAESAIEDLQDRLGLHKG
jgi:hypothetical protein